MAFGYKVKNIKFKNSYSIQELYETVKDYPFSAGKPSLVKYMGSTLITFPALDMKNQVQITKFGFKPTSITFTVAKGYEATAEGAVSNLVLDEVTKGATTMMSAFGDNPKECMRLVDETLKELGEMNL